jgi:hypothetical protein
MSTEMEQAYKKKKQEMLKVDSTALSESEAIKGKSRLKAHFEEMASAAEKKEAKYREDLAKTQSKSSKQTPQKTTALPNAQSTKKSPSTTHQGPDVKPKPGHHVKDIAQSIQAQLDDSRPIDVRNKLAHEALLKKAQHVQPLKAPKPEVPPRMHVASTSTIEALPLRSSHIEHVKHNEADKAQHVQPLKAPKPEAPPRIRVVSTSTIEALPLRSSHIEQVKHNEADDDRFKHDQSARHTGVDTNERQHPIPAPRPYPCPQIPAELTPTPDRKPTSDPSFGTRGRSGILTDNAELSPLDKLLKHIKDHPEAQNYSTTSELVTKAQDQRWNTSLTTSQMVADTAQHIPLHDLAFSKRIENDKTVYDVELPSTNYTGPVFMPRLNKDGIQVNMADGKPAFDILYYNQGTLDPSKSFIAPDGTPPQGGISTVTAKDRKAVLQLNQQRSTNPEILDAGKQLTSPNTIRHAPPIPPRPEGRSR